MDDKTLKLIFPFLPDHVLNADPTVIPFISGFIPKQNPSEDKPSFITGDILKKIVPILTIEKANELAIIFNKVLSKYGLDKAGVFHEFIAQVAHESGGFQYKTENLNYSTEGLLKVFPKYFTIKNAPQYARNPQLIANRVYANRMGNGDEASGDGWRNRGGGDIQLTGKAIWTLYSKYLNKPVEEVQNLVRTTDEYALDSAAWYFVIYASLKDEAEKNQFLAITHAINGGEIGEIDREAYYKRAKQYLPL